MQLIVEPNGGVRCIYGELLDLTSLGTTIITRASHVEPCTEGGWSADLRPVGGPVLGPFTKRSEALAAEVRWLKSTGFRLPEPSSSTHAGQREAEALRCPALLLTTRRNPMLWLFQALTDRLKALFVANVGLDLEAQLLARQAERKAELLRQAARYEEEGFEGVAAELREHAAALTLQRPLSSIQPMVEHFHADPTPQPALPSVLPTMSVPHADATNGAGTHPTAKKKGK